MSKTENKFSINKIGESAAMIRLTAIWALSEAGLGGILHLFRTPFTGLFVGGIAVIILSLMAYVSEKPIQTIPKALVLVLIVKMTISPHSPLPAYLAVSFQGLAAAFLFSVFSNFKLSCILLGFLALIESAIQKLITLTLLFGKSLWDSIDIFIDFILEKFDWLSSDSSAEGSFWIVLAYLVLYSLMGLVIGFLAGKLPKEINKILGFIRTEDLQLYKFDKSIQKKKKKSFLKSKKLKFLLGIFLLIILIYFFIPEARIIINPMWIVLRVVGILLIWYVFIAPVFLRLFQKFLEKKSSQYKEDVENALSLIPDFKHLVFAVWNSTSDLKAFSRIRTSIIKILAYALIYNNERINE